MNFRIQLRLIITIKHHLFVGKIVADDSAGIKKMAEKETYLRSASDLLDAYQAQLLSQRKHMPNRIKFAIDDVIDMRNNNWEERTKKTGPKKIEEIRKQAETEKLQAKIDLNDGLLLIVHSCLC
jgi:hypothetical protein